MASREILAEAKRRLDCHTVQMGEILDGLGSDDWDTYSESENQLLAYAERCTWWSARIFRIYLNEGDSCEYLDVHLLNWSDPTWVVFHLELLEGGADIAIRFGDDVFLFAVELFTAVGDYTH